MISPRTVFAVFLILLIISITLKQGNKIDISVHYLVSKKNASVKQAYT